MRLEAVELEFVSLVSAEVIGFFLVFAQANVDPQLDIAASQVRRVMAAVEVTITTYQSHAGVATPSPAHVVPESGHLRPAPSLLVAPTRGFPRRPESGTHRAVCSGMRFIFCLGITAALAGYGASSSACQTLAEPVPFSVKTAPAAEATGVPTDVAILVFGYRNPTARLTTAAGVNVETSTALVGENDSEIRPDQPLLPHTKYNLEIEVGETASGVWPLSFTTGDEPTPSQSAQISLERWVFADDVELTSCDGPREGTCVVVPDGAYVEVMPALAGEDAGGYAAYYYSHSFITELSTVSNADDGCIRVRQRLANGTFTDPTRLCGADAPTYELGDNGSFKCTAKGVEHDGEKTLAKPGCSVAPGSRLTHTSATTITLAGLAAALFASRRRRR